MIDDRAVSTTLSYVIGLSIAFVLVTGLLMAGGDFVDRQREATVRIELRVLGQQVASDVSQADRLVQATSDNATVRIHHDLPDRVAGLQYQITVDGGSDPYIRMEASDVDVSVQVKVTNETDLAMTTVGGGPVAVNHTASDELELEDA